MPASFIAAAASSRLDPQPKFWPPTMMSPRFTLLGKSSSSPTIRWLAISPGSYVGRNHIFGKMRSVLTLRPNTQVRPLKCIVPSTLDEFGRCHDVARDCGGGDCRRRRHIGVGFGTAETTAEIAASIGDGVLGRRQHALMTAGAGTAARHADRGAGVHHHFDEAFTDGLLIDLARAGIDHHPGAWRELLALHDGGGDPEVVDAAAGAGTEDRFVDPHVRELVGALDVGQIVRHSDEGGAFATVETHKT